MSKNVKGYIEINKACYEQLAFEYDYRKENKSWYEESALVLCDFVLKTTSQSDVFSVLEIGPGAGQCLSYYSSLEFHTVGVELSPSMAEVAYKNSPKSILIVSDILSIDFPSEQFDIIFMGALIHLFPKNDAMRLLNKVHYWLKPSGRIFINTTCHDISQEGFYIKEDYSGELMRFRKYWTEDEFYNFIHDQSFKVLDTMYTDEIDRQKKWVAYVCEKK